MLPEPRGSGISVKSVASSQACHLCEAPSFPRGKAALVKDATLEEDGVGPPRSALVTSTLRGCSDYLEARAQQREPI